VEYARRRAQGAVAREAEGLILEGGNNMGERKYFEEFPGSDVKKSEVTNL
jgi:hypothetical protein